MKRSRNKGILLVLLLFTFSSGTFAQTSSWTSEEYPKSSLFLRGDYEYGFVLVGENDLPPDINQVMGGNIEVGWQTAGRNVYDRIMGYPAFGFGFLTYGYPQTGTLGKPNAFYMFLNSPIKRWDRWAFNWILRLGMSYNWEPSDAVFNTGHLALGSFRNLYIAGGFEGQYLFGERSSIAAGFKFSHFSNGQSSLPNAGMNLLTPHVSYKYDLNGGARPAYARNKPGEFDDKSMEYYFTIGSGIRQVFFTKAGSALVPQVGVSYPVYNLSVAAQYHYTWAGKFGGGLDFIYWGAYDPDYTVDQGGIVKAVEHPFADHLQLGVFVSYEFVLANFSIYAQPGYRIIRKEYKNMPPDFYQHLALKYHVNDLILGVAIRAVNFGQAEYIEWNIGYRFRKKIKQ
jgi:hypothetical protein